MIANIIDNRRGRRMQVARGGGAVFSRGNRAVARIVKRCMRSRVETVVGYAKFSDQNPDKGVPTCEYW